MSVRTLHYVRAAAENHARQLANLAARPVFWGQHPLLNRGWMVELIPSGDPGELIVLTLPDEAVRERPTWPAQVLEAYLRLQDRIKDMPAWDVRREGLASLAQALLDRTGFTTDDLDVTLLRLTPHTTPERSHASVAFTDLEKTP